MINFLKAIGLIHENVDVPQWMEGIHMFDDIRQIDVIRESREKIQEEQNAIKAAEDIMSQNERYKSILYTSGDKLVEVVLDILGQMLGYDFSVFEDKKKEDFLAEIGDDVFIGEIKGVNHNVKSENVSQLDVHYQSFLEDSGKSENHVFALLIMNHQKNKDLTKREPVHENQVKLAKRNGSLIIDTFVLLKLFEKYKSEEISREYCMQLLKNNTGILNQI